MTAPEKLWLAFGLAGQALFASRFVVQWINSEIEGRSVIPKAFWHLSIAGSLVLFAGKPKTGTDPAWADESAGAWDRCRLLRRMPQSRMWRYPPVESIPGAEQRPTKK